MSLFFILSDYLMIEIIKNKTKNTIQKQFLERDKLVYVKLLL